MLLALATLLLFSFTNQLVLADHNAMDPPDYGTGGGGDTGCGCNEGEAGPDGVGGHGGGFGG